MKKFALVIMLLAICACREDIIGDNQAKHPDETVYITNAVCGWKDTDTVSVNGAFYPVEVLDSVTARVCVPYCEDYSILYPHDTKLSGREDWPYAVSEIQQYDRPIFICHDRPSHSDYFPFTTAVLQDITPRVEVELYAIGKIEAESVSATFIGEEGRIQAFMDCSSLPHISTGVKDPTRFSFAVAPGTYNRIQLQVLGKDEHVYGIAIQKTVNAVSGETFHAGKYELRSSNLMSMAISLDANVKGVVPFGIGTAVNVNGAVCYALSSSNGTITVPVTKADGYTVSWPAEVSEVREGSVSFAGSASIGVKRLAPDTSPRLAGWSDNESVVLKQTDGVLRIKIYTNPSIKRMIKSIRVTGKSFGSGYSYDVHTGQVEATDGPDCVDIIPEGYLQEGTSLADDYTSFCINLPEGQYNDVKMYVTAYDASYKCPYELTTEDLLVTTEYPVGYVDIKPGEVKLIVIHPKVEYFDWIRSNGTPFIGSLPYDQALQGVINTGWLMPAGKDISIEYEATVSGAVFDIKAERCLFGAQGGSLNKPVTLIYNKTARTGWYATMACVAGNDTYSKAEKGTKTFHIDRDLADKRVIQIGTEGVFGTSYIYFRYKNLDRGDTAWTDLWEESDYFRFKEGTLKCNYPVILFANNKAGSITGAISDIRFHNFKITCKGVVERDMYPCTVDGIPGMHDKAHDKYYFNDTPSVLVVTKYGCYSPMEVGN